MVSGFNTNVRRRGVVFHVQTEDSGRAHPHIITHLYYQGTILASEKSGYDELLDSSDLVREVKERMERQHQTMLNRLRAGEFDALIRERVEAARRGAGSGGAAPTRSAKPRARRAAEPPPAAGRRPLDELILDYLVENARKRKHRAR